MPAQQKTHRTHKSGPHWVTKCAVTQGTQKGRLWATQVSLTVTSTTGQHGHGTARSHLHTQRTHDGPSVSYCSTNWFSCVSAMVGSNFRARYISHWSPSNMLQQGWPLVRWPVSLQSILISQSIGIFTTALRSQLTRTPEIGTILQFLASIKTLYDPSHKRYAGEAPD